MSSNITSDGLLEHTLVLASPLFQGRFPGSDGEKKTIKYLTKQFQKIGAQPGNTKNGTYVQSVPLMKGSIQVSDVTVEVVTGTKKVLKQDSDVVSFSRCMLDNVDLRGSEVVFVGYGIVAPEYKWNDYQGLDVKGKTVICLVNDPGFATGDTNFFKGRTMTYYGRWIYKYEEAARQGAAGVYIVHETEPAGYGWNVVCTGKSEYFCLEESTVPCLVHGWLSHNSAIKLFQACNLNYEQLKNESHTYNFRAIKLPLKINVTMHQKLKTIYSDNFLALLPGSSLKEEVVVYSAHYDHFGVVNNDVYAGARDNALGVSACIAIAKAFASIPIEKRLRSVLFLIPTAEEQGLLGSAYYINNPTFPLSKIIACLNFDVLNIFGRTKDVTFYGWGNSELDDLANNAAKIQNRVIKDDPCPENGMFFRSDHFNFAKGGVPSLYINMGFDHVEKGSLVQINKEWTLECYHKPADVVVTDKHSKWYWDLTGAVEDVQLVYYVGCELVLSTLRPNWRQNSEFKKTRDAQISAKL